MDEWGGASPQVKAAVVVVLALAGVGLLAGLFMLEGLIVWALWNALVPSLAGGPSITYVQGVLIGVAMSVVSAVFRRR